MPKIVQYRHGCKLWPEVSCTHWKSVVVTIYKNKVDVSQADTYNLRKKSGFFKEKLVLVWFPIFLYIRLHLWLAEKKRVYYVRQMAKRVFNRRKSGTHGKKVLLHVRLLLQILFGYCGGQTRCSSGQWSWLPISRLDLQVVAHPSPGKWQCRHPLQSEIARQRKVRDVLGIEK